MAHGSKTQGAARKYAPASGEAKPIVGSSPNRTLRATARLALSVLTYYATVILIFVLTEAGPDSRDWNSRADDDWAVLDAVYFATVLMSTVGYGDITPKTTEMQMATVALAFVGIAVVFSQCAWLIGEGFKPVADWLRSQVNALNPPQVHIIQGIDGSTSQIAVPQRTSAYYMQNLAPVVGLFFVMELGFAAVLHAVQDDLSYWTAFYQVLITSTTVGLGDIDIEEPAAKGVVIVHIFASVGTWALILQEATGLYRSRKKMIERLQIMMRKRCAPPSALAPAASPQRHRMHTSAPNAAAADRAPRRAAPRRSDPRLLELLHQSYQEAAEAHEYKHRGWSKGPSPLPEDTPPSSA